MGLETHALFHICQNFPVSATLRKPLGCLPFLDVLLNLLFLYYSRSILRNHELFIGGYYHNMNL